MDGARFAKGSARKQSDKEPAVFFTPKKRGRDWCWFHMMILYAFTVAFGVGAIVALISPDTALSERIALAVIFSVIAVGLWRLGRHCSTIVAKMGDPQ